MGLRAAAGMGARPHLAAAAARLADVDRQRCPENPGSGAGRGRLRSRLYARVTAAARALSRPAATIPAAFGDAAAGAARWEGKERTPPQAESAGFWRADRACGRWPRGERVHRVRGARPRD